MVVIAVGRHTEGDKMNTKQSGNSGELKPRQSDTVRDGNTWVQCNVCGSTGWRCEHCSPTGDIQSPSVYTSASVNTINGGVETCDHCHDSLDCESCEKPEQWEELHEALWAYSGALDRKQWSLEGAYSSLREHMRMIREVSASTKGDISAYYNSQCVCEDMHNKTKDELDAANARYKSENKMCREIARRLELCDVAAGETQFKLNAANARIDEMKESMRGIQATIPSTHRWCLSELAHWIGDDDE